MFYMRKNNDVSLFDEMSNLFNGSFMQKGNIMKTDIIDKENEYVISVEIPGVNKENIKIDIEEEYLTVSITKEENKEDNTKYLRRERKYESMSRSFYVGEVQMNNVKAKVDNGVLNITIPKALPKVEEKKYIEIE